MEVDDLHGLWFGSAALWGRARRGLGAVRGRGSRLRGRWSFSPAGFRRAWPRGGRSDRGAGSCVPCSWARDCAVPGGHAPSLGRRHARARVERSRVACAGVYAVPARAGWGRVNVGAALQGFGRAQRQRVSGAEDAGSVGVCLPGANNVMSRTHLRQDARALSRSLERSLPLSLSLSRSLSPRSLARSLGVCVHARMRRCVNEAFRIRNSVASTFHDVVKRTQTTGMTPTLCAWACVCVRACVGSTYS